VAFSPFEADRRSAIIHWLTNSVLFIFTKRTGWEAPDTGSNPNASSVAKGEFEVKNFLNVITRVTPFFFALVIFCSNPVKDMQWRTSVDLPITANKKFFLAAMMDTIFFNKNQVLTSTTYDTLKRAGLKDTIVKHVDTTMSEINTYPAYDSVNKRPIPDTVAFGFPAHDTALDTISQDSLADKYYEDVFGPIPLSGAPNSSVTVPLAGPYTSGTPVTSPPVPLRLKWIYHVELKDTVQFVTLSVTNNSQASFSQVIITLGTLGADTINNLSANATATAQYNAQAKMIDSIVNVTVSFTPSTTGAFAAVDNLSASISFGNLVANKVVALDSLFAGYVRTFTNEYNLTDTVDVDYIDISKGFFNYTVTNHTGLQLQIAVTHRNLWRSDFCQGHTPPLDSVGELGSLSKADSDIAYGGEVTPSSARVDFPPGDTSRFSKTNISGYRLFPEWDPVTKKSVTKVDYRINVQVNRDTITMSSGDSLSFAIKTTSFKFAEMFGHSMDQYNRISKPSVIPVKLPWTQAVTDSLRGNLKLQKVLAIAKTRVNIPPGAFIDTMLLHYVLSSVTHPGIACSSDVALLHVMRDSVYTRPIDITNVVNDYPDSVLVNVSLRIPVNTALKVENDLTDPTDPEYSKFIGRMIIDGLVDYNLKALLCWTVLDTTIMDLGGSRVDLSDASGVLDPFGNMTDTHGSLNMQTINFTNVYLRLYALVVTDTAKIGSLVDTTNPGYIKTNQFTQLINNPTDGYISLLKNGVLIPPRDSTAKIPDTVNISDPDLRQILKAKTLGWRWEARLIPRSTAGVVDTTPDALYNTDWMKINSWIHIDGVNSVNSLSKKTEEQ
jgi:hypothetical protein